MAIAIIGGLVTSTVLTLLVIPTVYEVLHGARVRVRNLEALDGTPIVDVKPVLDRDTER